MIAPELEQLTRMFDQATAPTFFLFAIAAIVDRMNTRLAEVTSAMRGMVAEGKKDSPLHRLYQDRAKLLRRGRPLVSVPSASFSAALANAHAHSARR